MKPKVKSEASIQIEVLAALRQHARENVIWFHIPNGEKRDARTAAKLKKMGVTSWRT